MTHTERMWWNFLKAVKNGQHRLSPMTWIAGIAAIIYTISPIDLIPELVFGPLGLADDLGVWGIFGVLFTHEYRRWQAGLASN